MSLSSGRRAFAGRWSHIASEATAKEVVKAVINHGGQRREIGRRLLFDLLAPFTPSVAVERHAGIRYYVNTADRHVSRNTFGAGNFEFDVMADAVAMVEQVVGRSPVLEGRVFVDVGANIGTTTLPALRIFGASEVLAFEPEPENARLLRCNVVANGYGAQVRVFDCALSNEEGVAELEISGVNSGDHRVRTSSNGADGEMGEADRATVEVRVSTFDRALAGAGIERGDIGLVWIDTQGFEGHVLSGARSVVGTAVPILCEYWPYGLRRAGGLELFHDVVRSSYRSVIDVRRSTRERPHVVPVDRLDDLARDYPAADTFTDLILIGDRP